MIFNIGGAAFKPPVLNPNYPADVNVVQASNASATFQVVISEQGEPAEYKYQWYVNNSPVSGATGTSFTKTGLSATGTYVVYCQVTHPVGVVTSRSATLNVLSSMPSFTFNGSYEKIDDGNGNWRIKLKSSSGITFSNLGKGNGLVDIFCVGGGGAGYLSGGGGGYTQTVKSQTIELGKTYSVVIGAGGSVGSSSGTRGGTTSFGSLASAAGGYPGTAGGSGRGGDGASGGGDFGGVGRAGNGGSNGSNGGANWIEIYDSSAGWYWAEDLPAGQGQGRTTTEFGEGGTLYAGGGGGGSEASNTKNTGGYAGTGGGGQGACPGYASTAAATAGAANTGGGGGGGNTNAHASKGGGSGIIVIRNHR